MHTTIEDLETHRRATHLLEIGLAQLGKRVWLGEEEGGMGEVTIEHLISVAEHRAADGQGPQWSEYANMLRQETK